MANDFLKVYLESNFQYTSANYKFGQDEDSLRQLMEQELLDYKLFFEQGKWLDTEVQHIATELEKTGKLFAKNQGFGEGPSIFDGKNRQYSRLYVRTGNLVNGIHAKPENTKNGWTIMFWNDAKNERNQYYAGHMEYGFHDRGGNFIPARPFMRPALYAVAEGSKGNFRNIMQGLLGNIWTGKGFQGVSQLSFGTKSMSPQSNFWSSGKDFTGRLGAKSNIGQLRGDKHRKQMSTMRPTNPHSLSQKPGYRLSANRSDFTTLRKNSGTKLSQGTRKYKKESASVRQKSKSNSISRKSLQYTNREKFNQFNNNLIKQRLDTQRKIMANKAESARKAREEKARVREQRIRERDERLFKQNKPGKQNKGKPGKKQQSEKIKVTFMENKNGKLVFSTHLITKDSLDENYVKTTVVDGRVSPIESMPNTQFGVIKTGRQKLTRKDVYVKRK